MRTVLTLACVAALLAGCGQQATAEKADTATGSVAPAPAATQTFQAGSMPIHPVQVNATLTSLTGVDTAEAAMSGRVTRADAQEFCERDPNGDSARSSVDECVSATLASETAEGATGAHMASADCVAGTLSSSDWGDFRLTGTEKRHEGSATLHPVFINPEGGQALGNAGGEYPVTAMFEILCPARAAAWKAS